jgi:hypothetical protein
MDRACSTNVREECVYDLGRLARGKETTSKTKIKVGGY